MARFRATIQGQRGTASRLGSPKTGLTAHVNGWHSGVRVQAEALTDGDRFWIHATGGSNGAAHSIPLGVVERTHQGDLTFIPYAKLMKQGAPRG